MTDLCSFEILTKPPEMKKLMLGEEGQVHPSVEGVQVGALEPPGEVPSLWQVAELLVEEVEAVLADY